MTEPGRTRRAVLKAAGATALGVSVPGCAGSLPSLGATTPDNVVLDPPANYEARKDADLPTPLYGEPLPEATVPAALQDREVTTTEFVGERHVLLTFVFTRCSMACPALTASLVHAQGASIDGGFPDAVAFLPITFDPAHDTPSVIESYAADQGVDLEAGNWWFLRPEGRERVESVVTDTFGVYVEYLSEDEREVSHMAFAHSNLVVLANADGYVERAYTGEPPNPATVVEDLETVDERW